jgi:hypothetical protein
MKQTYMRAAVMLWTTISIACGPGGRAGDDGPGGGGGGDSCPVCSEDKQGVVDCDGRITQCPPDQACSNGECMNACSAAERNNASIGCDYYAVDMDGAEGPPRGGCFAVFVANTSRGQVHMDVAFGNQPINLATYAKIPSGQGQSLTYAPYDPAIGLAPGQVAILFLAQFSSGLLSMSVTCPVPAAIGSAAQLSGTGLGQAFHIKTDLPVVAYQMLPYGGGRAAATGASLLLPTSSWSTNYVAVTAYDTDGAAPPIGIPQGPSMNIVAMEDDTVVEMRPRSNISGGNGLPAGQANQPYTFSLAKGQHAQITQLAPLSGSPITSNKPIGVFGGHQIMSIDRCCGDHGEQMLPPVRALGWEYVAAPHPDRKPQSEPRVYRIFGAVEGTELVYDPPGTGPAQVTLGQMHEIRTSSPFTVRSQGSGHPFLMFTYMTGAGEQGEGGWGDPDFVRLVPPAQFMSHYVFFADPTYPYTALTVVRPKKDGKFHDVNLACLGGAISGWQPVGGGEYEITYVKLVDAWGSQSGCNNGVNTMSSEAPFGVWVWGWGSEATNTGWVSYGFPAGEGVIPINDVVIL